MKLYTAFLLLGLVAYCYAGKEGLAWGDWDTSNLAALAGNGLKPSWIYTWSPWNINVCLFLNFTFTPNISFVFFEECSLFLFRFVFVNKLTPPPPPGL
jgi:hypothetical protein